MDESGVLISKSAEIYIAAVALWLFSAQVRMDDLTSVLYLFKVRVECLLLFIAKESRVTRMQVAFKQGEAGGSLM